VLHTHGSEEGKSKFKEVPSWFSVGTLLTDSFHAVRRWIEVANIEVIPEVVNSAVIHATLDLKPLPF
jgi:hypothetical protein